MKDAGIPKVEPVGGSQRVSAARSYSLKVPGVTQGRGVVAG